MLFPDATREIYWNIHIPWRTGIIVLQALVPIGIMTWGFSCKYRQWKSLGKGNPHIDRPLERLHRVFVQVFGQRRLLKRTYPGILHFLLFYGIALLFIGTIVVAFQSDVAEPFFNLNFFTGAFYQGFSLILDLAGLAAVVAVFMGLWRRYIIRPDFIGGTLNWNAVLWLLLAVLLTGFIVEGLRIAATRPPWALWSPVGATVSFLFHGIREEVLLSWHKGLWWSHLLVSEAAIAYVGFGVLNHIFIVPLNIFSGRGIPTGTVEPIRDFETAEEFGVSRLEQFTRKQLLDAVACVECGRCEQVCPAFATEKPLNPKKIIGGLKTLWDPATVTAVRGVPLPEYPALLGDTIDYDAVWACTTCGACEQECPAQIEQIDKIIDMRRYLTLMESNFSPEVQTLFVNLEQQGNPWGLDAGKRTEWTAGLDVPLWEGTDSAEVLLWVGCAGAYDARAQSISIALVKLLKKADVRFAILGEEEHCTGDAALRLGNEYLYQMLAEQNIETLRSKGVKKIVTTCPHCFQALSKDYRALGGTFEVEHHSQILARLIRKGRLKTPDMGSGRMNIAFHDSCYLGRHNRIYDAPRDVVRATGSLSELKRNRNRSFCCGAGGGRMWMEEKIGKRINVARVEEIIESECPVLVTNCPFCKTMLDDGIKELHKQEQIKVRDIAELFLDRCN